MHNWATPESIVWIVPAQECRQIMVQCRSANESLQQFKNRSQQDVREQIAEEGLAPMCR